MKRTCVLLVALLLSGCVEGEIMTGEYFPLDTPIQLKAGDDLIAWYCGRGTVSRIAFFDSSYFMVNGKIFPHSNTFYQRAVSLKEGKKYEMIYLGANHNILDFLYMEHSISPVENEYLRPAFSLRIPFDISKSKTFSFGPYKYTVDSCDRELVILSVSKR